MTVVEATVFANIKAIGADAALTKVATLNDLNALVRASPNQDGVYLVRSSGISQAANSADDAADVARWRQNAAPPTFYKTPLRSPRR
jgi:hypothetical protein